MHPYICWICSAYIQQNCIRHYVMHTYIMHVNLYSAMHTGSLRWVGSLKSKVSLAEYSLFDRALLQKRRIILRSLLVLATPYIVLHVHRPKVFMLDVHTSVARAYFFTSCIHTFCALIPYAVNIHYVMQYTLCMCIHPAHIQQSGRLHGDGVAAIDITHSYVWYH